MARTATANRTLIMDRLSHITRFVSAQTLYADLKNAGSSIGLATIYRNLQALAEAGLVDCLRTDGETLYRLCTVSGHHHHLVCTNCAETVELPEDTLEKWTSDLEKETGFTHISHTLEFSGLCKKCS